MDVTEYKKEIEKVQGRVKSIEGELIKNRTLRESLQKDLKENFGITEAEIPAKLEELKTNLSNAEVELDKKLKEFKEYLTKIEERLS